MMISARHSPSEAELPGSPGGRELACALALLEGNHSRPVTLAALRDRGIHAPAQAIYDLQLAGYTIDRVTSTDADGHASTGYHLREPQAPAAEPGTETTYDGAPRAHSPR